MPVSSDIGFTNTVKSIQDRKGSRKAYANTEFRTKIDSDLTNRISLARSIYLGTCSAAGQPYIQHRGGPPGFLKVIDDNTIAFADFRGNRQYISQGNLEDNNKAFIFLMNYAEKTRVKIWGSARIVEDNDQLLQTLAPDPDEYRARAEQIIVFTVEAWDLNCPQHIPQRVDAEEHHAIVQEKDRRIEALQAELDQLRSASSPLPS